PDALGVAAVLARDRGAELLHAARHRPGEAVERRPLCEDAFELARLHPCDRRRVERAEPAAELLRRGERALERDLLVEDEADQERERGAGEQLVGLVVTREVEVRGRGRRHGPIYNHSATRSARASAVRWVFAHGTTGSR